MSKIYILVAKGPLIFFNGTSQIMSVTAYRSRNVAECHIPQFSEKCCNGGLYDLDPNHTKVTVQELELDETDEVLAANTR